MSNDGLQQLKALALAATPGPWEFDGVRSDGEYGSDDDGGYGFDSYQVTTDTGACVVDCLNNDVGAVHVENDGRAWDKVAKQDAQYIAAASPDVVLALVAEVEQLRAAIATPPVASGALPELPEPLEINWPTLNRNALGCGVEDRGLHDRYMCAEYGWEDGVDRAIECVPEAIYDADQMRAYGDERAAAAAPNAALVEALRKISEWHISDDWGSSADDDGKWQSQFETIEIAIASAGKRVKP